ncbi:MAG TPA: DUF1343 domain-containing protein, partial [Cyclobacteriaceae bacterium]
KLTLKYLIELYNQYPNKDKFFLPYFEKLAGTDALRKQIESGMSEDAIRQTWKEELDAFKMKRSRYLIYK